MTVEPTSTRANWINSDSLDWLYMRDLRCDVTFDKRVAYWAIVHNSLSADPKAVAADSQRHAGPGASMFFRTSDNETKGTEVVKSIAGVKPSYFCGRLASAFAA